MQKLDTEGAGNEQRVENESDVRIRSKPSKMREPALASDIDSLMELEEDNWEASMRHSQEWILQQLRISPMNNFVLVLEDGDVIAVSC